MHSGILQAINGVSFAALLFLLASGFTLSFGLMRVVNMAHGAYYLFGGYIGLTITRYTGPGGAVMGLGYALYEEHIVNEGRPKTASLAFYLVPTPLDVPEIECLIVEVPDPESVKVRGPPQLIVKSPTAAVTGSLNPIPSASSAGWHPTMSTRSR